LPFKRKKNKYKELHNIELRQTFRKMLHSTKVYFKSSTTKWITK